jgi:hypothetical protein
MIRKYLDTTDPEEISLRDMVQLHKILHDREMSLADFFERVQEGGYPGAFDAAQKTEVEAILERHGVQMNLPASAVARAQLRELAVRSSIIIKQLVDEGKETGKVIDVTPK